MPQIKGIHWHRYLSHHFWELYKCCLLNAKQNTFALNFSAQNLWILVTHASATISYYA